MKNKKINYLTYTLIVSMIILRVVNKMYFEKANNIMWIFLSLVLILLCLYLTIKFKFIQFRFIKIIKSLFIKKTSNNSISSIDSLFVTMAGRIGVGSLSGIAIAIYSSSQGVIFWMWISSLLFSILTYIESYLGVKYQEKNNKNYIGGPSYYISKGIKNKNLAILYAIMIIFAYIMGFLGIQSNTIIRSTESIFNINPLVLTIVLCIITMLVIFNKTTKIISIISKFVPIMTIIYILLGIFIIIKNINNIPIILTNIIKEAFNFKTGIISVIIIGIQRGLFATESGLGTSAISSAISSSSPKEQGLIQLFGVHFTTLIISTITAITVINSNYDILNGNINGIEILTLAFYNNFGKIGSYLLYLITILFAFSTIISGYFYGENSLKYIVKKITTLDIVIFKIFTIALVFIGGIIESSIMWKIVDTFVLLLTIINVYSIYKLKNKVK